MSGKIKLPHPFVIIAGIGLLLYTRSFSFGYTNFDDNALVQENQEYISNLSNISDAFGKTVFITGSDVFYRPVETIWFILNAQLGGADLFVYHLSSVLLHLLAVWLIFLLLIRMGAMHDTALFLSVLFLVHPALTQAVTWVPGVVDILVAVFVLASFLFFLDFLKSSGRKHYIGHMLFFTLALFSKETGIVLPALCLFYILVIKKEKPKSYNTKVFLAGWAAVSAVWFMMRDAALQGQATHSLKEMVFSAAENLPGFFLYTGKILLPFNLSVMPVLEDNTLLFGIVSFIVLAGAVFFSKEKKMSMVGFGVLWFALFLLPTFIRTSEFRVHQFYEHRMYLPFVGVLIVLLQADWIKRFSFDVLIARYTSLAVLLIFSAVTLRHQTVFSDTRSFLDNAVASAPHSSLAHRNQGIYFQDLDEVTKHSDPAHLEKAAQAYRKALELNPMEKDLHNNLGVIYDTWGKKEQAMQEYLAETNLNPANSQAWHNLGVAYASAGKNEQAEKCFKNAIERRPLSSTYQQLALLYKNTGRKEEFEKIVSLLRSSDPANGKAPVQGLSQRLNDPVLAGRGLMQQGKLQEAEQLFLQALASDSFNKEAWFNLGLVYYSSKRLPDAEAVWKKAVQADSSYTDALNNLAICFAQQGKNADAEKVLKRIVVSNPGYIDGYFNMANFYAKNKRDKEAMVYIDELKKKGITRDHFAQRGIRLSAELEKLFDQ